MSTKGKELSITTKYKISVAKQKDRREIVSKLKQYADMLLDPKETALIPSIVSASLFAGISKKALLAWELTTADNSEVRAVLDFVRDMEEKFLRENGLLGKTDSKLTTVLLKAEHGIKEEPTQLTQNNTFNVSPELLAEAIELSRTKKPPKKGS
jgi:hypothetical protein